MCKDGSVPHYPAFRPACFQQVGPDDDPGLSGLLLDYPASGPDLEDPVVGVFRVRTPNLNLMTRVSLVLQPHSSTGINTALHDNDQVIDPGGDYPTLWVAGRMPGFGVSGTQTPPVRDVVGTRPAPLPVPTNLGLWGFDFSLQTWGEELYGVFTCTDRPLARGQWRINVQYNSVDRLSSEEWERARQAMGLIVELTASAAVALP